MARVSQTGKKKNPNNRCVRKWAKSVLVRRNTARQCDGDCPGKKEKSCETFVLLTGLGLDDVTQFWSFLGLSDCSDCVWFHGAAVFMLRFMEHSVLCEVLRNGLMGFKYPAFILKLFFVLDFVENSSRIIYLIRYFWGTRLKCFRSKSCNNVRELPMKCIRLIMCQ